MTVRIATWNLWWRFENYEERQPAILETLQGAAADVIALQECWPAQVEALADALGFEWAWAGRTAEDREHPMGNAILSRWPLARTAERFLADHKEREYRTALFAEVDSPHGPLPVFCTHLEFRFDKSATRVAQLQAVSEFVEEHVGGGGWPPVLCGDLNAVADSDEIRRLTGRSVPYLDGRIWTDAWEQVGDGPGLTWSLESPYIQNSAWPNRRLDYVLIGWPRQDKPVGNPAAAILFGVEPVDGVTPSDHYCVAVDLIASTEG